MAAGVSPKVVSERLGHSTVAFTLQVYPHAPRGMQADAAERFAAAVAKAAPALRVANGPADHGSAEWDNGKFAAHDVCRWGREVVPPTEFESVPPA